MVGPGQVDDALQVETQEECARSYGPVRSCLVYEVRRVARRAPRLRVTMVLGGGGRRWEAR